MGIMQPLYNAPKGFEKSASGSETHGGERDWKTRGGRWVSPSPGRSRSDSRSLAMHRERGARAELRRGVGINLLLLSKAKGLFGSYRPDWMGGRSAGRPATS